MGHWYLDAFSVIKKLTLSLVIFVLLLTSMIAAYFLFYFPKAPLLDNNAEIVFNVARGTSVKSMVKQLQTQAGLSPFKAHCLSWWLQLKRAQKLLKAGEYAFSLNITPKTLLDKMIKGDVVQHALTIAEGATFEESFNIIAQHPLIKKTITNQSLEDIMILLGENKGSAEGLFFPDTYYFVLNTSDIALLRLARQTMQARLQFAWERRSADSILKTPYEALILASIIEKEAANDPERFLISGVFQRRLMKNMRLQADPTVVYGLKNFTGTLTREHLKQDSPYNTYMRKGLPPTPIALPSMKSIEAALHPDKGDALYFVARGDGTHQFSVTLEEHNKAVAQFQRGNINESR